MTKKKMKKKTIKKAQPKKKVEVVTELKEFLDEQKTKIKIKIGHHIPGSGLFKVAEAGKEVEIDSTDLNFVRASFENYNQAQKILSDAYQAG